MACTGHTNLSSCSGHSATGSCPGHTNSCPANAGTVLPVTPTSWTNDPVSTNIKIKAQHHNELRSAIADELARWGASWPADPGAVVANVTKVQSLHVRRLRDGINAALSWSYPASLTNVNTEVGDPVQAAQYNALRDRVNVMESTCVCNCNYACTCNCNYSCTCQCNYACTCNCNYCTCNCNYCVCNCNYACTCNCNYTAPKSDVRLKYDIEYIK